MCPLSNLKLCVFPRLADHNLKQLLEAGLAVTVNSDDPAYFGGYINDNFVQLHDAVGLTAQHAYQLARNSFEASFVDGGAQAALPGGTGRGVRPVRPGGHRRRAVK